VCSNPRVRGIAPPAPPAPPAKTVAALAVRMQHPTRLTCCWSPSLKITIRALTCQRSWLCRQRSLFPHRIIRLSLGPNAGQQGRQLKILTVTARHPLMSHQDGMGSVLCGQTGHTPWNICPTRAQSSGARGLSPVPASLSRAQSRQGRVAGGRELRLQIPL